MIGNFLKATGKLIAKQNLLLPYHLLVIGIFSAIYWQLAKTHGTKDDKKHFLNFEDSFYYTTITHFTIGFGDISPEAKYLRRLTLVHVFIAFILLNL